MLSNTLLEALLQFRRERDWEQFHSARNLAASISVEAAELLESFIWASDEQVQEIVRSHHAEITDEIADIAILLTYLAHDLSIDIDAAVMKKIQVNAIKYPVEKARGSNKKYSDL